MYTHDTHIDGVHAVAGTISWTWASAAGSCTTTHPVFADAIWADVAASAAVIGICTQVHTSAIATDGAVRTARPVTTASRRTGTAACASVLWITVPVHAGIVTTKVPVSTT